MEKDLVTVVHPVYLSEEQLKWVSIMDNFKRKTVRELVQDLEMGGNDIESAFTELQLLGEVYTPDEEEE